jgi:hypothetical protein
MAVILTLFVLMIVLMNAAVLIALPFQFAWWVITHPKTWIPVGILIWLARLVASS